MANEVTVRDFPDEIMAWYEAQPWLRAAIQAVPVIGGSADTLFAWRGTVLAQRRFRELLEGVSRRVADVEAAGRLATQVDDERFVELLKISAETATASASKEKRSRAAALLAGVLRAGKIDDLSNQVARDLAVLDDFHLVILASLPHVVGAEINPTRRPPGLDSVSDGVYQKGISDLERVGLVRYENSGVGMWGGGGGRWMTTEYMPFFVAAIADHDPEPST
jgi:hypothetical protein